MKALDELWSKYRDEEKQNFTPEEWEQYKTLFKKFDNFPTWLNKQNVQISVVRMRKACAKCNATGCEICNGIGYV